MGVVEVESKVSKDEDRIRNSGQVKVWMMSSNKHPLFVGSPKKSEEQSEPVQLIHVEFQILRACS